MTKTEYNKKYNQSNKKSILPQKKKYYKKNNIRIKLRLASQRKKYLDLWVGLIPSEAQCEMCGVDIYFNRGDRNKAIHFDHRHGAHQGKYRTPFNWLMGHKRTEKNELIWKSFDFGLLCKDCNYRLPTENRRQFIDNANKYMRTYGS